MCIRDRMERYFNTLKSELIYQHTYASESKLFSDIDDYVLLWYNSVRPHSFNNGLTPWQKRSAWFLGETVTILLDKNTALGSALVLPFPQVFFFCPFLFPPFVCFYYTLFMEFTQDLGWSQEKWRSLFDRHFFPLAVQLQVCLVALKGINADNIILYAPELYHVACGKACPVADLKQHFFVKLCGDAV